MNKRLSDLTIGDLFGIILGGFIGLALLLILTSLLSNLGYLPR